MQWRVSWNGGSHLRCGECPADCLLGETTLTMNTRLRWGSATHGVPFQRSHRAPYCVKGEAMKAFLITAAAAWTSLFGSANANVIPARAVVFSRETSISMPDIHIEMSSSQTASLNLLGIGLDVLRFFSTGQGIFPIVTTDAEGGVAPMNYFGQPCPDAEYPRCWDDLKLR